MSRLLRNLSIHKKLIAVLSLSNLISLWLGGVFIMFLEISNFQEYTRDDLTAIANLVGNRSSAALTFNDVELAQENLAVFNNHPDVRIACIFSGNEQVFTYLAKLALDTCPVSLAEQSTRFEKSQLFVIQSIVLDGAEIGKIYVHADLTEAYWRKVQFTVGLLFVLVITSGVAFFLTAPLLRAVSQPISHLVQTVNTITQSQDYSLRAVKMNSDELGELVDAFNSLIERVHDQNNELTFAKNHYLALYDDNPTMVFNLSTALQIISVNRTGAAQLNLSSEQLIGQSIMAFVYVDDVNIMQTMLENCLHNLLHVYKKEVRINCANHAKIWVRATARLVDNTTGIRNLLLVCEDVTEAHNLHEKIAYQASHDALTGLANRSQFDDCIKQVVEHSKITSTEHVLCYLDLDQFKVINDTCGHQAGDELLRQVGELLRKSIRRDDFIARLGGDEFGVLMRNCSLNEAASICNKLRDAICDFNFAWEDKSFNIGVSIGITMISNASGNAVNILKEADSACYIAKDKGRNRVQVFHPDDKELKTREGEMQWVEKIQLGLERDSFCLYGQPIVALNKRETGLHFETLIRYRNQDGVIIPPGAFLPAAERYNLAPQIDRWVIRKLFSWLAARPDFLHNLSLCSINLSGLSLSDEKMLDYISEEFKCWAIPTHKICFEITETAAIANLSFATHFINNLKTKGCLFSLDDFGSGLSSFAYLKNLPVDFLKIDGLFVKDILDDKVDLAMVRSINEVGQVLNKHTIAEFVENDEIFALLNTLGVDYAQGYGIGKPVPLDELVLIPAFARA